MLRSSLRYLRARGLASLSAGLCAVALLAITAPAMASTILAGTGSGSSNRWVNSAFSNAVGFTTASEYTVGSLLLDVAQVGSSALTVLTVDIVADESGSPGSTVVGSFITPTIGGRALYTFAPNGTIVLQAGQSYWVRLTGTGTSSARHDWFGELAVDVPAQREIISGLEAPGFLGYMTRQGLHWRLGNQASYFQLVSAISTPAELLAALIAKVLGLNIHHGIRNSLDTKLETAVNALDDMNENNDGAALGSLGAFIRAVDAQSGGRIDEATADDLTSDAQAIIDLIESP